MKLDVRAVGLSDVGQRRERNEDSILVDESLGLYIVADGMGGALAGDAASQLSVRTVREAVLAERAILDQLAETPTSEKRAEATRLLERAIQFASGRVHDEGLRDPARRGMGATTSALIRAGNVVAIGHVGDSRIYLYRQGKLHRLTEDHTLVESQLKAGILKPEDVSTSPHLGILTRCVGSHPAVQVDTLLIDLLPKDVVLLCSDGLYQYFSDDELEQMMRVGSRDTLARALIAQANARGGDDNISVVLLDCSADEADEETQALLTRIETVRKIALFAHLTYKEQMAVLGIAREQYRQSGFEIVSEGAFDSDLYLIVAGRVVVEKGALAITELGLGRHFGEMSLLESRPRSATVRCIEPTRLLVISQRDLLALMKAEPILAVKVLWAFSIVLSERLRTTNQELVRLNPSGTFQVPEDDEFTQVMKWPK